MFLMSEVPLHTLIKRENRDSWRAGRIPHHPGGGSPMYDRRGTLYATPARDRRGTWSWVMCVGPRTLRGHP